MRLTARSRKPGGLAPLPTSWVAFARRIFLTLLAIPSERTGGVAIARQSRALLPTSWVVITNVAKNAREAVAGLRNKWELREHLPSRLRQQRRPPSSGRDGKRRRANATSEAGAVGAICVICVFLSHPAHSPLTHLQSPEKTTKYVRHITSKKRLGEILNMLSFIHPGLHGLPAAHSLRR